MFTLRKTSLLLCLTVFGLFLIYGRINAQSSFIHISWKSINANYETRVKNFPVDGSVLRIGVSYQIFEKQKSLSDKDFNFLWRVEPNLGYVVPDAPEFVLPVNRMPKQTSITIQLRMKSKISGSVYQKEIIIPLTEPQITLMKYDQNTGLDLPFNSFIPKKTGRVDIVARPFYFTVNRDLLDYSWTVNNRRLSGSPARNDIITLNSEEMVIGPIPIMVFASNRDSIGQFTKKNFTINIAEDNYLQQIP